MWEQRREGGNCEVKNVRREEGKGWEGRRFENEVEDAGKKNEVKDAQGREREKKKEEKKRKMESVE